MGAVFQVCVLDQYDIAACRLKAGPHRCAFALILFMQDHA